MNSHKLANLLLEKPDVTLVFIDEEFCPNEIIEIKDGIVEDVDDENQLSNKRDCLLVSVYPNTRLVFRHK